MLFGSLLKTVLVVASVAVCIIPVGALVSLTGEEMDDVIEVMKQNPTLNILKALDHDLKAHISNGGQLSVQNKMPQLIDELLRSFAPKHEGQSTNEIRRPSSTILQDLMAEMERVDSLNKKPHSQEGIRLGKEIENAILRGASP